MSLILQRYLALDYSSFKIRSTKSEILHSPWDSLRRTPYGGNKSKILNSNDRNKHRHKSRAVVFDFGFWSFVFVSSFELRISNLNAYPTTGYLILYHTMYRSSTNIVASMPAKLVADIVVLFLDNPGEAVGRDQIRNPKQIQN
jgi:hypothetical protein